jgi:hypothetical protein
MHLFSTELKDDNTYVIHYYGHINAFEADQAVLITSTSCKARRGPCAVQMREEPCTELVMLKCTLFFATLDVPLGQLGNNQPEFSKAHQCTWSSP